MCGRYGRRADKQRITEWMQRHDTSVFDVDNSFLEPSYNVCPQSFQPVVRLHRDSGERQLAVMRWGLVPAWSKDGKIAFNTINACAETVTSSPTFREAFKHRRCLIPADLFYEWKKLDGKKKQPYGIGLKDAQLFAFAGLWERWQDMVTGHILETYTILTTDANELIHGLAIHNRMPVILRPPDYGRWLDSSDPQRLPVDLLRPYEAEYMRAWKVNAAVGNTRNNNPGLCEPVNSE